MYIYIYYFKNVFVSFFFSSFSSPRLVAGPGRWLSWFFMCRLSIFPHCCYIFASPLPAPFPLPLVVIPCLKSPGIVSAQPDRSPLYDMQYVYINYILFVYHSPFFYFTTLSLIGLRPSQVKSPYNSICKIVPNISAWTVEAFNWSLFLLICGNSPDPIPNSSLLYVTVIIFFGVTSSI